MKKLFFACALAMSCSHLFALTVAPANIVNQQPLDLNQMKANPMDEFQVWYNNVIQKVGNQEAACFVLATVSSSCEPSTRSMMAKLVDKNGIAFFGNLSSRKFQELQANPAAAATFFWYNAQQQISITGKVQRVSEFEAKVVFDKRDRMSQITSHISQQGQEIGSFSDLQKKQDDMNAQFKNRPVPMPTSWGGYRLIPDTVEFWQLGANNMHSRILYTKGESGQWIKTMISP